MKVVDEDVLRVASVSRREGRRTVLAGVDLAVQSGETVALVGANGAGKSTLIRTILDLRAAHGGTITLAGRPNTDRRARAAVAYLPERFQPPTYLSGSEFLDYMLSLYRVGPADRGAREVAAALGLGAEALARPVATYSKGMGQLLGLTACIASGRRLLIFDEPMDGLDPAARVRLRQALEVRRAEGASVLFSTHLLTDAAEFADRIAILHDGRIAAAGSVAELCARFEADDLESAYLYCTGETAATA
ncbi:ABC transporter ATP-binding protein [Halofilum ochraceum]|uniref:ABC transporter ATP-binding protein n=1 Tax=Halofilum ochraceum TaxID=1611323 RepID=UPI0008D94056|nr:ABC transporter ATP-binding protein [Halofilum ochraceum]